MDLITRDRISPTEEPRWYMPDGVSGWEPERTVFTSWDEEKQRENREEWETAQFNAHRAAPIALSAEDVKVADDEHGGYEVDPAATRDPGEVDRERREVSTLYARLAVGRLPWMAPATFRWFNDILRRDALRKRQRTAIIGLLRRLGRDPMSPAVVDWVTSNGYDAALAKLAAAAQRQGVAA